MPEIVPVIRDNSPLSAYSFVARFHESDMCGPNGLPLVANSIEILGRYQRFAEFQRSPFLACSLHLQRFDRERIIIATESSGIDIWHARLKGLIKDNDLEKLLWQSLQAIHFLHQRRVIHRNLKLNNIFYTKEGDVMLSQYELYNITNNGSYVDFFIGDLVNTAPEVVYRDILGLHLEDVGPLDSDSVYYASDVWSLAVIFFQLIAKKKLFADLPNKDIVREIMKFSKNNLSAFDSLTQELKFDSETSEVNRDTLDLLRSMLTIQTTERPTVDDLLTAHFAKKFTADTNLAADFSLYNVFYDFKKSLKCNIDKDSNQELRSAQDSLNIRQVYDHWTRCGGDLKTTLTNHHMFPARLPIKSIPRYSFAPLNSGDGSPGQRTYPQQDLVYTDSRMVPLSMDVLYAKLAKLKVECIDIDDMFNANKQRDYSTQKVPLSIRESDLEYQVERQLLFTRLILSYPMCSHVLISEARRDIPPLYRGIVWACGLGVKGPVYSQFSAIDKHSKSAIDRQIDVDIPRCHQYCNMLSSKIGHTKLKRIIKAWLYGHPEYVYWQGLDSLAAPFVYQNFNNEAIAYASLTAFIEKNLKNFFLKDNSAVIQEYLAIFSQLITFHNPQLSSHLHEIQFTPDLYAIPWFLTMFAHILPLDRLSHLWDTLLLENSAFPLFIGVSIIRQLSSQLIHSDFNQCILLFSDMPEINIDECLKDSFKISRQTPMSSSYRRHESRRSVTNTASQEDVDQLNEILDQISLHETQMMISPRIWIGDLLDLFHRVDIRAFIVIDCRQHATYLKGTFESSLHQAPTTTSENLANIMKPHSQKIKIVIGYDNQHSDKFCRLLIEAKVRLVCYLYDGVKELRERSLFTVPPCSH